MRRTEHHAISRRFACLVSVLRQSPLLNAFISHMTDKRKSETEVRNRVIDATASLLIATVDEYGLIQCRARNDFPLLLQLLGKVASGGL